MYVPNQVGVCVVSGVESSGHVLHLQPIQLLLLRGIVVRRAVALGFFRGADAIIEIFLCNVNFDRGCVHNPIYFAVDALNYKAPQIAVIVELPMFPQGSFAKVALAVDSVGDVEVWLRCHVCS